MSFPALFLACQAAASLPTLDDDEFGLSWADIDYRPGLEIIWAAYRSAGAGIIFGVKDVREVLA